MKEICTYGGYVIPVDDGDFDLASLFVWYVELCGRKTKKPRVYTHIGGRKRKQKVYLSRMLMREPPCTVDHRSGDTLDHQRVNLRLATQKQNSRNSVKHHPLTSKFKGVSLRRNRHGGRFKNAPWAAFITVDYQRIKVGFFADEITAAQAYDHAAREHFGQFAHTNFDAIN